MERGGGWGGGGGEGGGGGGGGGRGSQNAKKNAVSILYPMADTYVCVLCINYMCVTWNTDVECTLKYS